MHGETLDQVAQARRALLAAQEDLQRAILDAGAAGARQRDIAHAAGLTLAQVWLILSGRADLRPPGIRRR